MLCVASIGVAENDALVVATVVKAIGSNWFDSMDWEGTRWAEENGAEMHYIGPTEMDSAAQLQSLDDAIALQPDILTVVPIAADACDAVLAGAREQGTVVVTHEGSTLTNIDYNVDAFNNQEFGEMFAKKAVELYDEEFTYCVITSTLSPPRTWSGAAPSTTICLRTIRTPFASTTWTARPWFRSRAARTLT